MFIYSAMTAHRINYENRVGFAIPLQNGMWKCRFTRGELRILHKSKLTIFSEHPNGHSYMDTRELSDSTVKELFNL